MKKYFLKVFLIAILLTLCMAFSAYTEGYEEQFNSMDLEELQSISDVLNRIINEKKIGSAILIVDPAENTLAKGKTMKLNVTSDERKVTPKTVLTFESSDENVAKVAKGIVTGVNEGTATIKVSAQFEDGAILETSCTVNVFVPVTALKAPLKANTFVGGEMNLADTITFSPENATEKKLVYSVDDESIATIDEKGIIKGIKGGIVKVTVESVQANPTVKKLQISVSINEAVGTITLNKTRFFQLGKGKTEKLSATVGPESATNKLVEWKSENPEIASVTAGGSVTGKKNGTTDIICTAKDGSGVTASVKVMVITSVSSVKFSKATMVLTVNQEKNASYEVLPKDATDKAVTWSSSDSSIASVESGKITAHKAGQVTITMISKSDPKKRANMTVYVEPKNPAYVHSIHWQTTWGQRNGKMGISITSLCSSRKIKSITVKVECTSWYGGSSTDYVTYSGMMVYPGKEAKSKLTSSTVSGFSTASTVKITPISVTFDDGTEYNIPSSEQLTTTFTL